jgi:hypothetical protein
MIDERSFQFKRRARDATGARSRPLRTDGERIR